MPLRDQDFIEPNQGLNIPAQNPTLFLGGPSNSSPQFIDGGKPPSKGPNQKPESSPTKQPATVDKGEIGPVQDPMGPLPPAPTTKPANVPTGPGGLPTTQNPGSNVPFVGMAPTVPQGSSTPQGPIPFINIGSTNVGQNAIDHGHEHQNNAGFGNVPRFGGGSGSGSIYAALPPAPTGSPVPPAANLPSLADVPEPTRWDVDESQLVENRMASIMDSDSPAIKALSERMRRAHLRGGGQNSLMAQQAAGAVMAQMAFSMASQDASTIARSHEFNAAMANQYGLAQQSYTHNALLSDQNFRQALQIDRQRFAAQMASQASAASANASLQRDAFLHDARMAEQRHGQNLEMMGTQYGLDVQRDQHQSDLNLRNASFLSAQDFSQQFVSAEQAYFNNIGTMGAQAFFNDELTERNFRRERILNYDNQRIQLAGMGTELLTNLGSQPGMTDSVIEARYRDMSQMWQDLGLIGESFYLNGMSNDNSYPGYFNYPNPTSSAPTGQAIPGQEGFVGPVAPGQSETGVPANTGVGG